MTEHPNQFINQQWVQGTGAAFLSRNPATGDVVWQGVAAAHAEVEAAVKAARKAFPAWAQLPLKDRIAYLEKFSALLRQDNPLAETISQETGKPLWESKEEVLGIANKVAISIQAYAERCPERSAEHPLGRLITRHKPHGVVAVFGPFNFPGHLPHGHIIPALLAGNTVIFKPSEHTPKTGEILISLWEKCELPPGALNMVQGARETGSLLATHAEIDGLFFTGSCSSGMFLSELFAKTPEKILALELGGNNPLVVHEISDLNAAALVAIQSAYLSSGQRCSCARRLILTESKKNHQFIETLIKKIGSIQVGPYNTVPEPFMGPVISEESANHLLAAQSTLKGIGGHPLVEMKLLKIDTALLSPGLMDVTRILNRPDEEIFGPFLQLIRVPNFEAAIAEANRTQFGLTAGLLSDKEEHFREFHQKVRAGVINWNVPTTGASSAAPFGGLGRSGNHRPSAYYAADYTSSPVASIESNTLKIPSTLPPGLARE